MTTTTHTPSAYHHACPQVGCVGIVSPTPGGVLLCGNCGNGAVTCQGCCRLNREVAVFCTGCGERLQSAPPVQWPMGRAQQARLWPLKKRPGPRASIHVVAGTIVYVEPDAREITLMPCFGTRMEPVSVPAFGQAGSIRTQAVQAANHLVWGDEAGLYGYPFHILSEIGSPPIPPRGLAAEAPLGPLLPVGDRISWLSLKGYHSLDLVSGEQRTISIEVTPEHRLLSAAHDLVLIAAGARLIALRLTPSPSQPESVEHPLPRDFGAVLGGVVLGPDQALLLGENALQRVLLQENQVRYVPLTHFEPTMRFRAVAALDDVRADHHVLFHDEGLEVLNGATAMFEPSYSRAVANLEPLPRPRSSGRYALVTRLDHATARFMIEIHDIEGQARVKFVQGYHNVLDMNWNTRWLALLGDLDGQPVVAAYDLCAIG